MMIPREKLEKIAIRISQEKPRLHFLGLVHRTGALHDRWDLLVSSDKLAPWTMEALNYVVDQLKKVLTSDELIRIARVIALPRDNPVIASLLRDRQSSTNPIGFPQRDRFDEQDVIWPLGDTKEAALPRKQRRAS